MEHLGHCSPKQICHDGNPWGRWKPRRQLAGFVKKGKREEDGWNERIQAQYHIYGRMASPQFSTIYQTRSHTSSRCLKKRTHQQCRLPPRHHPLPPFAFSSPPSLPPPCPIWVPAPPPRGSLWLRPWSQFTSGKPFRRSSL